MPANSKATDRDTSSEIDIDAINEAVRSARDLLQMLVEVGQSEAAMSLIGRLATLATAAFLPDTNTAFDVKALAAMLGVSEKTVYAKTGGNAVPNIKPGRTMWRASDMLRQCSGSDDDE